jgi:hypothetical protein
VLAAPLRVGQQAQQPLAVVQQQVRPFVGCEAARETHRQCIGIEQILCILDRFGRCAESGQLP